MMGGAEKTNSRISSGLKTKKEDTAEWPGELWSQNALLNMAPEWTGWLREKKLRVCEEKEGLVR